MSYSKREEKKKETCVRERKCDESKENKERVIKIEKQVKRENERERN